MGSNSSSQKKNIYNTSLQPKEQFNTNTRTTSYQSGVHRNTSANNPFEYNSSYVPAYNSSGRNDLSRSTASNSRNINFNIWHVNDIDSEIYNDYKKHSNSERMKQDAFDIFDDVTKKSFSFKEECSNKNQTIYMENKPASITVVPPSMILTKDDFMTTWFSWKKDFLKYMESIDQVKNRQKWGIMLLNRIGPIGQEIYRTFIFDNDQAKEDIDILLEKFDYYCIFQDRKREDDEEIDKYVNNLKVMASKHVTNSDIIVKEKVLKEIDKNRFTIRAKSLISSFSFPLSIQSLTLKEITYIWMTYENINFKQTEKIDNFLIRNCSNCGKTHIIDKCLAYGKKCNECNNEGHYWTRCPSKYIVNCSFCGEDHFFRQCPAYLNECSNCGRPNHFSWKCPIAKILNCKFCGLTHIASKSKCPAINTICTNCGERGHFVAKCYKRRFSYKR